MARLGLKLYYLRTRERRLSQVQVADAVGTRQATLSHIEQGASMPSCGLLVELCRFFDVTPTYLLDDERGLRPRAGERWSTRDALATAGMWVECNAGDVARTRDGKLLCPLAPGEAFYDAEAAVLRRDARSSAEAEARLQAVRLGRAREESELIDALERELAAHPRHREGIRQGRD